jgi:uncharacterized protein (TIGR03435 family)
MTLHSARLQLFAANLFLFASLTIQTPAQAPVPAPPQPSFPSADVHPSPARGYPIFYALLQQTGRYVIRDATMADLVATAYNLDPANIQAGPAWLDLDRFDILARVPPHTTRTTLNLMLRSLLEERFHLVVHKGERPIQAYVLTAIKPTLKPAETDGEADCDDRGGHPAGPFTYLDCRFTSTEDLAHYLHTQASDYLRLPIVNATSLDGKFDFNLKWSPADRLKASAPAGISIFDAVESQLGLKLTLSNAPRPILLVDSVDRAPAAPLTASEKPLAAEPLPQFDAATLKPARPDTTPSSNISGGVIEFTNYPLKAIVQFAWNLTLSDPNTLVAPKFLEQDRYDIFAKVPPEATGISVAQHGGGFPMDIDDVKLMLRALVIDRFHIVAHLEDRPIDAYTLVVAGTPKLKPADPTTRTRCKVAPTTPSAEPGAPAPILDRTLTCSNVSMPEFATQLHLRVPSYIQNPVQNDTHLNGSYDLAVSYTAINRVNPAGNTGTATEPDGTQTLFDAMPRQLGLKLEKHKRPLPVLVIDHIDPKPAAN